MDDHPQGSLSIGRDICNNLAESESREWFVTNGLGGYAAGTISGILTRRYHGLLIAALKPPVERMLLLAKLEETAMINGQSYVLSTNRYWRNNHQIVEPEGYRLLDRFALERTTPVWIFAFAGAQLEKRIWMLSGDNTTYIRYTLLQGDEPLTLTLSPLVTYRDHHASPYTGAWYFSTPVEHGLQFRAEGEPFYLLSDRARGIPHFEKIQGFYLSIEQDRGYKDYTHDYLRAGIFTVVLNPGESMTMIASTRPDPLLDSDIAYAQRQTYEQDLLARAQHVKDVPQLVLAADQFIVERALPDNPEGKSVIAGYPWFSDWGRDTMISLPGLTLTTGRPEIALSILTIFARFVDQGMLPNRFPDAGQAPEYNTVDATLWYFEAIRATYAATHDLDFLRKIYPILQDIIRWHRRGTRYNIHVDPADGLLYAGGPGTQLTWMDVKIGDRVVTPRVGKPVEINALWYNAQSIMAEFAQILGQDPADYLDGAKQTELSFRRFWNPTLGYCYDVLDTPDGSSDSSLRPNQLFAVSLPASPLTADQQRAIVDHCQQKLLTPCGLRTLSPDDPSYAGHYTGNMKQRDAVYHQGTVWPWLIGPFASAHLRVYKNPALTRALLRPLFDQFSIDCMGSINEIFDGDPPHTPQGCFAQAWSIAELLRAWADCV